MIKHTFTDTELLEIFETARVALNNSAVFGRIALDMDLNDAYLESLKNKLTAFLNSKRVDVVVPDKPPQEIKTINLTPSWAQAVSVYCHVLQSGAATGEGKDIAREELMRLARAVDELNKRQDEHGS